MKNAMGLPKLASGGFATTFTLDAHGKRWAVRCFHKKSGLTRHLQQRYEHINEFVSGHGDLGFLIPVTYDQNGIQVRGSAYPTVRMPWVDGDPLGLWLEDWAADGADPDRIEIVRRRIADAVKRLRALDIAHGDLQHGNILVDSQLQVRLIDYDGMYLPSLRPLGALEMGHRNYQHPGRGKTFDYTIDHFAAAVIDLSLLALRERPQLWEKYGGTGENLLFEAGDFVAPAKSRVFDELTSMVETADLSGRLRRACQVDYAHVGNVLLGHGAHPPSGRVTYAVRPSRVFDAAETDVLRAQEGEVITVVGTVKFAKVQTRYYTNEQVALINLGRWSDGDFTIYAEEQVCEELYARFGSAPDPRMRLSELEGWRVSITGPLELYEYKRKYHPTIVVPQIRLPRASLLHNLPKERFNELMVQARRRIEVSAAPHSPESVPDPGPGLAPSTSHRAPADGAPGRITSPSPQQRQLAAADKEAIRNRFFSSSAVQPTEQPKPGTGSSLGDRPTARAEHPTEQTRTMRAGAPTTRAFREARNITPGTGLRPAVPPETPNPPAAPRSAAAHGGPPAPSIGHRIPEPPESASQANRPPPVPNRYRREPFPYRPPPPPPHPADSRWAYTGIVLTILGLLVLIVLL
ncbi:serine/threonine protein kinase [Nocardia donostiensis]|nr:serine/threonine-protein kinase [Nocardia donostiensis]